jgi:hypothetical protein
MPVGVQIAVLGCKASIAVLLLVAGGAKLADLPGFADVAVLFLPRLRARRLPMLIAAGVAAAELAAGAASLSLPRAGSVNLAVLAICCCFLAVATTGYLRHRGRSCRCFGALSGRGFGLAGVVRAAVLVLAAAIAIANVPHPAVAVSVSGGLALLAGGALVAGAAFAAAAAVGSKRDSQPRWT